MKNIRQIHIDTGPANEIEDVKYLLSNTHDQTKFDLTVTAKNKMTEQEFIDWLQDFVDYYNDNEGDIFSKDSKIVTGMQ